MKSYEQLLPELQAGLDRYFDKALELNQYLATHPELGNQEFETSRRMAQFLEEAGLEVEYPFAGLPTAFRGSAGTQGPLVAIMAEEDALPGVGHGCGHCLHGTMSLLAGAALKPLAEELGCRVQVVGTPAEETDGAKVTMAAAGLFDGCDLAMMVHCAAGVSRTASRTLAMDALEFTFKGRSSHASGSPWEGRSALAGVQLFGVALDSLRQFVRPEIRIHGVVTRGGLAPNVVPDDAACKYYFRAPTRKMLNELMERVYDCARGAALATGTSVSWANAEFSFDNMMPNLTAEDAAGQVFDELGIAYENNLVPGGSSDMGNVSQRCPALEAKLAISDKPIAGHSLEFAQMIQGPLAPAGLRKGAQFLGRLTLKVWLQEDLRRKMKEEYEANLKA